MQSLRKPNSTLHRFLPYGLLLLAAVFLYGRSLWFGYVWDDGALFLDNTTLRESAWSWGAIFRPIFPDVPYFRPLVLASWMAEMYFFHLDPFYSHAINLLLHAANVCLVYAVAKNIFNSGSETVLSPAFCAALIYSLHPCLVESVAWVSGRFDLLATTLLMAGFYVALGPQTVARGLFVALLVLGSMLSKEIGVLFAPLFFLLLMARGVNESAASILKRSYYYIVAYVLALAFYFLLRSHGLGFASYEGFGLSQLRDSLLRYETWLRTLSFYTYMSVFPFRSISPRHDLGMELLSFRQNIAPVLAAVIGFILCIVFAFKRRRWAVFGLGFYVAIFPVIGFFPIRLGETIGAERFLYLPLSMLALSVVAFYDDWRSRRTQRQAFPLRAVFMGWAFLAIFVSYTTVPIWKSDLHLWGWQYKINPGNKLVRLAYLVALSKGNAKDFEQEIEKIRENNGGHLPAYVQSVYSMYLLETGDPEALPYLRGLIENYPRDELEDRITLSGILLNYSQALVIFEGDLVGAEKYLREAEKMNPRGAEYQVLHQLIAIKYLEGKREEALKIYKNNRHFLQAYDLPKMMRSMKTLVHSACVKMKMDDCQEYANGFVDYVNGEGDGK